MENKKKPLLICMTPVRNEAWILNAFLTATSLWADHIIIADQNSSDGSREIALSYPKVTLIENNNPNFNESERQKLLINKAREIEGDKILFAFDADEILDASFSTTNDWEKIISSKKGDVFLLKWAMVMPDKCKYWLIDKYYPWIFHDDGLEPHGNYVSNIHSMRIPYPIEEKQMYNIDEFRLFHFVNIYPKRNKSKQMFYMFVDYEMNRRNIISLSRTYINKKEKSHLLFDIKPIMSYTNEKNGFDIYELIDTKSESFWFDNYINEHILKNSVENYKNLDIWKENFLSNYRDPRPLKIKFLHFYLRKTKNYSDFLLIKVIDKILKKITH